MNLSMFSWIFFYQCTAQSFYKATGCFPTYPSLQTWSALSKGINPVAMTVTSLWKEISQGPPFPEGTG